MDKPGCYMDNVGKSFDSCEAELKDFVENSPFCPQLLKTEFQESQRVVSEGEKEKPVQGDAFDELYTELDAPPVNAPQEEWMECFSLGLGPNQNDSNDEYTAASDDEDNNYDIRLDKVHVNHDWQSDRKELRLTDSEIKEADNWIDEKIKTTYLPANEQCSVDPSTLNDKQRKAYNYLIKFIDSMYSDPNNTEPIYLNISGRAGCGKTYFINCVSKYAKDKCGSNFLLKAAPTATAGFLIGGQTLHSLFKLPLQKTCDKELPDLSPDSLKDLQTIFHSCKLLVIDEKSMAGLYMLYAIDKRLREIKCKSAEIPFGGISIVLMGDFAQLPPVGDKPLFTGNIKDLSIQQSWGKLNFELFKKTIIFNQVMRQQGDDQQRFREVLDKLSNGTFDREDWNFLKERDLQDTSKIQESERKEFESNATMICAYNKDMTSYNISRIKALGNPIAIIKSENSSLTVARLLASKAQGLPSQIMLAKECEVILTTNLWKEAGLTNGAKGIVKYIVYEPRIKPKALPSIVIVQFPQYVGPSYQKTISKCAPITPIKRSWFSGKTQCWRRMLPLKPAYGTTIHSSQGQSLDRVIINIGKKEFSNGLTYTAISRCKKIEMLAFKPMESCKRFTSIFQANVFKYRQIQDEKEKQADQNFDDE